MKRAFELSPLKVENKSLKGMLNDSVSVCPTEKKQKSKKYTHADMNLQHVRF